MLKTLEEIFELGTIETGSNGEMGRKLVEKENSREEIVSELSEHLQSFIYKKLLD